MSYVNKLLNGLIALAIVAYFYAAIRNFWMALPYLLIFTAVLIPSLFKNNGKYLTKLTNYFLFVTAKLFSLISRKIEIDRGYIKGALVFGGIFYLLIIMSLFGSYASFEKCIDDNGLSKISHCYSTYERRELTANGEN